MAFFFVTSTSSASYKRNVVFDEKPCLTRGRFRHLFAHVKKLLYLCNPFLLFYILKPDIDILIEESRSHIAQMLGHAEEMKNAALHEQRLLDALCMTRGELDEYKRKYDAQSISLCPYINVEGVQQTGIWQPEQLENKLREACEQDSKTLANFLKENEKKGYLDFHGDSKQKILNTRKLLN